MANVALAVTPAVRSFPFIVPPGEKILGGSAIPIARLTFQAFDVTIVAKIATNTTSIVATCTLPPNFVYTFEYASAHVIIPDDVGEADNYDDIASLIIAFADGLGPRISTMNSTGITGILANAGSIKHWRPLNAFPSPIFNQSGASPVITLDVNDNNAADTNEGDFSCVVSVLQYELTQAFSYPLNFALPVITR